MKIAVFSTKAYDRQFFDKANAEFGHKIVYFEPRLTLETCKLAFGFEAVCVFVNDQLNADVLRLLHQNGVRLLALRSAGFNHVDIKKAQDLGMTVVRVPAYSPHGVAEHAVALILALNRKLYRAHNRIHEGNFSLEGLLGFELTGKTVGVIGTGRIGNIFANIMMGFSTDVIAYDPMRNPECRARYVALDELFNKSDIISLHLPLTPETKHMIGGQAVSRMKPGVMLINTSRGALIDTREVIKGLKSGKIGYLGLDVYEEEADLFFEDLSDHVIQDDIFARLLTFPNVLITGHQAFFTDSAMANIAHTTLQNIDDYQHKKVRREMMVSPELVGKN